MQLSLICRQVLDAGYTASVIVVINVAVSWIDHDKHLL